MVVETKLFRYKPTIKKEIFEFFSNFPRDPDAILVFSRDDVKIKDILLTVRNICPSCPIVGSTVEGIICDKLAYENSKMFIIVAFFLKKGKIIPFKFERVTSNEEAGGKFLQNLVSSKTSFIFLFTESIATNVGKILSVFDEKYNQIPIFGFASGDGLEFKNTYQFFDLNIYTDSMVGLIFEGDFYYNYLIALKTKKLFEATLTEVEDIFINKINYKKALDFVGEILEKADIREKVFLQFLLGIKKQNKKRAFSPIFVNYEKKSFQVLESFSSNEKVDFIILDEEQRIEDIKTKVNLLAKAIDYSAAQAGFINVCASCGKLLYENSEEEVRFIWEKFDSFPLFGTFNFGPIFNIKNANKVSNFVTTFFVFGER